MERDKRRSLILGGCLLLGRTHSSSGKIVLLALESRDYLPQPASGLTMKLASSPVHGEVSRHFWGGKKLFPSKYIGRRMFHRVISAIETQLRLLGWKEGEANPQTVENSRAAAITRRRTNGKRI
jgi:hypothetical protein